MHCRLPRPSILSFRTIALVCVSLCLMASSVFQRRSGYTVIWPDNHYRAVWLCWCKAQLQGFERVLTEEENRLKKARHVNSSLTYASQNARAPKHSSSAAGAAQINCRIVTDMMADHLGQEWCLWCTLHHSLPGLICPRCHLSNKESVTLENHNLYIFKSLIMDVSSGRRQLPTSQSFVGRWTADIAKPGCQNK